MRGFFHSQGAMQSEGTWRHCVVALIENTRPFHCLNDESFSCLWPSLRLRIYPHLFLVVQMSFPSHMSGSGGLEVTGWGTWAEIRLCFQTPPLLVGNASLDSSLLGLAWICCYFVSIFLRLWPFRFLELHHLLTAGMEGYQEKTAIWKLKLVSSKMTHQFRV